MAHVDHKGGFRYERLSEPSSIRLIELATGRFGDIIRCQIHEKNNSETPEYEAVSYVWGSEDNKILISCNGQNFYITQNLAAGLRRFRQSDRPRRLWVDSVCIDQENLAERSEQVKIMTRIYSNASRVLIWLGGLDENTAREAYNGLTLSVELYARFKELEGWTDLNRSLQVTHALSDIITEAEIVALRSAGQALTTFFENPWFSRAWTFQESFVARSRLFQFGTKPFIGQMRDVLCALAAISEYRRELDFLPPHPLRLMSLTMSQNGDIIGSLRFEGLLAFRQGCGCKNPSDLIYSLLGIATDSVGVEPDYSKRFEGLFAEVVLRDITTRGRLSILKTVVAMAEASTLPSWVPDWRLPYQSFKPHQSFSFYDTYYLCTGTSRASPVLSSDSKELKLRGLIVDQIWASRHIASVSDEGAWVRQTLSRLKNDPNHQNFSDDGVEIDVYSFEGRGFVPSTSQSSEASDCCGTWDENIQQAILRVRCIDLMFEKRHRNYSRWGPTSHRDLQKKIWSSDPEPTGAAEDWLLLFHYFNDGRKLILTREQRLGVTPRHAKVGDIIALLLGGEVPIILRPQGEKYTFVGECYVDGIMDGEGLVEARRRARPEEECPDFSWLHRLHEEPLLFNTVEFTLV